MNRARLWLLWWVGCFVLGFAVTFTIGLLLIKAGWLGPAGLPW